jgi:hypothetical protein
VENYVPGKLAEMGLGYEQLKEINPKLIYASITGTFYLYTVFSFPGLMVDSGKT